jgi:hypothetical protein
LYSQNDIFDTVLFLTERIDELTCDEETIEEFRTFVYALYTRNGALFCEATTADTLDMPNMRTPTTVKHLFVPNQDYMMFCTIYFNHLLRRLYYYDKLKENMGSVELPSGSVQRCKEWVKTSVLDSLGTEGFEDAYSSACEQCYHFPGDTQWFQYRYPARQPVTGPVLDCIRPVFAKRYFSDDRVTKDPILAAVDRCDHQGQCSRVFVLVALDQYMKTHYNASWRDAVVIDNEGIELSQFKLVKANAPCLLQLLSRYWVYDQARIYPCDNIYSAITTWMYILREKYNAALFGVSLATLTQLILQPPTPQTSGNRFVGSLL